MTKIFYLKIKLPKTLIDILNPCENDQLDAVSRHDV